MRVYKEKEASGPFAKYSAVLCFIVKYAVEAEKNQKQLVHSEMPKTMKITHEAVIDKLMVLKGY